MHTRGDDGDIFEFKSEGEYMPEQGDHNGRIAVYKFGVTNWQILGNQILTGIKDFRYG